MIRQMGISPGIMNFQTFGTLNHPIIHDKMNAKWRNNAALYHAKRLKKDIFRKKKMSQRKKEYNVDCCYNIYSI